MIVRLKQAPHILSNMQLNRALMARQYLLDHVDLGITEIIERLVGLQAQVPAASYVSLWSRLRNFEPEELSGLLEGHRAVRAVLMRSTLHLVSARDFGAIWPLTRTVVERQLKSSEFARDLVGIQQDTIAAVADKVLKESPSTQVALARALASHWPDRRSISLAYAIRSHLPLVQIPPRGLWGKSGQATWARAQDWLGHSIPRKGSIKSLFTRYLAAFGPATVSDFQSWSGLSGVRDQIERLRPQLRIFRDEHGRELFDSPENELPDSQCSVPVRFLPEYDNVLLAHADRSRVIPAEFRKRISIGQPTLLIDGFVRGTWKRSGSGSLARLEISLFNKVPREISVEIRKEATRLARFIGGGAIKDKIEITQYSTWVR